MCLTEHEVGKRIVCWSHRLIFKPANWVVKCYRLRSRKSFRSPSPLPLEAGWNSRKGMCSKHGNRAGRSYSSRRLRFPARGRSTGDQCQTMSVPLGACCHPSGKSTNSLILNESDGILDRIIDRKVYPDTRYFHLHSRRTTNMPANPGPNPGCCEGWPGYRPQQ